MKKIVLLLLFLLVNKIKYYISKSDFISNTIQKVNIQY